MKSMKNAFVRAGLLIGALFVLTVGVTGCVNPVTEYVIPKDELDLDGTWVYHGTWDETYKISLEDYTFDAGSYSYAGNDLRIRFTGSDSGYIYIKYTRAFCLSHSNFDNYIYTYDGDAPDVGKWYAISFKNLTDTSIQLSGAYGSVDGHKVSATETLKEAIAEFTIENGYFATYSDLVKE